MLRCSLRQLLVRLKHPAPDSCSHERCCQGDIACVILQQHPRCLRRSSVFLPAAVTSGNLSCWVLASDQVHAALRKFSDRMAVERGATSCRSPPVVLGNVQPYNQTTAGAPSQSKLPPYARDQRRVSALPSHDPLSNPFPWIATPRREGSYELSRCVSLHSSLINCV